MMFIINKTAYLEKVITKDKNHHTNKYSKLIHELFTQITLYYETLEPELGPDGFNYASLHLSPNNKNKQKTNLKTLAFEAIENGFGATVNKNDKDALWVFKLGDFIPLSRVGKIISYYGNNSHQIIQVKEATTVEIGMPNQDIIPEQVRKHLRLYIKEHLKIEIPRYVLEYNEILDPPYTIYFDFSERTDLSKEEISYYLARLLWYFPGYVFLSTTDRKLPYYRI
jgi:hypothetical protein